MLYSFLFRSKLNKMNKEINGIAVKLYVNFEFYVLDLFCGILLTVKVFNGDELTVK